MEEKDEVRFKYVGAILRIIYQREDGQEPSTRACSSLEMGYGTGEDEEERKEEEKEEERRKEVPDSQSNRVFQVRLVSSNVILFPRSFLHALYSNCIQFWIITHSQEMYLIIMCLIMLCY